MKYRVLVRIEYDEEYIVDADNELHAKALAEDEAEEDHGLQFSISIMEVDTLPDEAL